MGNLVSQARKRKHFEFSDLKATETEIEFDAMRKIFSQFRQRELNTIEHRSVFITDSMRMLYAELARDEIGWTRNLKGASGAGKSTHLLFIGHMAVSNGCLVFSLQGHEMLRFEDKTLNCANVFTQAILHRWIPAVGKDVLSAIKCPLDDSKSLYDLVSIGAKDSSKSVSTLFSLISNMCRITVVPVVMLIDQCNVFHNYGSESESANEVADFCKFISSIGHNDIERGCILRAYSDLYSASFRVMPISVDGDSLLNVQISPMNSDSFALFVQTLITSFHPKVPIPIAELMSLCAGLPREAVSIFFLIAANPDDVFDSIRTKYFVTRTTFYEHRIRTLTDNHLMTDAVRKESVTFAAQLFIGERMTGAPPIWEEAGLIVRKDSAVHIPCEAAERGLIRSFSSDTVKAAIKIFSSDSCIRWRALELAFTFVVRQSMITESPVTFQCTDLRGGNPRTVRCSVDRIVHYSGHLNPSSVEKGTLVVCPRGTAVIDFLLFGNDGVKIYVQVSECAYVDHYSNVEDIPTIDALYQNALVQTAAEMKADMEYLYISTSRKLIAPSAKFNSKVLLISNAGHEEATRFFRNLL
jgi:hypothetical protein